MNNTDEKMNDRDKAAIARIQEKYSITTSQGEHGTAINFADVPETFNLTTADNEFTIFTDEWHEHFADMDQLLFFFDGLFAGTIQIVVKYRGKTPVGHRALILKNGKFDLVSQAGSLLPLFWRRKSFKTMEYKMAHKAPCVPRSDSFGNTK